MDNKSGLRILFAIAIIVGFFLPVFKGSGSMFDIVKTDTGQSGAMYTIIRYSFLLPALFALFVLTNAFSQRKSSFLLRILPLIAIGLLSFLFVLGVSQYNNVSSSTFFSILGVGWYLTVIGSLLLAFV